MKHARKLQLPPRKNQVFNSISEFILGRKLGDGAYAVVRKAIHIESEATYAIKIIALASLGENDYENVEKELDIHSTIEHPHIIGLVDFFKDDEKVYLVLEFAHKGNLFKFMHDHVPPDPELMGTMWAQTVSAIAYLHSEDIIMRDLKPENILVSKDLGVKICDFGWAARIDDVEYRKLKAGTYIYMSPESLLGKLQSFQSDVWSLGVLLFEMHHNREPFSCGISCHEQLYFIREQQVYFKSGLDERVKILVSGCLVEDKSKRFQLKDLTESAYVKEFLHKKSEAKKKKTFQFLEGRKMIGKKKLSGVDFFSKTHLLGQNEHKNIKKLSSQNISFTGSSISHLQSGGRKSPGKLLSQNLNKKKTIRLNDFVSRKISKSYSINHIHTLGLSHSKEVKNDGFSISGRNQTNFSSKTLPSSLGLSSTGRIFGKTGLSQSKSTYDKIQEIHEDSETFQKDKKVKLQKGGFNQPVPTPKSLVAEGSTFQVDPPKRIKLNQISSAKKMHKKQTEGIQNNMENAPINTEKTKEETKKKPSYQTQKNVINPSDKTTQLKRSNTFTTKPMFTTGFTKRHKNVNLFSHKKNHSLNDFIFKKIDFAKVNTQGTENTTLENNISKKNFKNSKMETFGIFSF